MKDKFMNVIVIHEQIAMFTCCVMDFKPGVAKVVDIDPLRVHGVDRDLGVEWKSINSKIECEL
ncbi:hypothetical protein T4C_3955 [Trichinella pseudospiralis]|uniref:Uncharacterized protein n=1 Tax=Trichinella pseudospiralis TaxID=6337 RepID=A0A0V1JLE3_TRIPS|nr:hypothetical protein T4C_3955 [Trichinella pseudospiralis]